MPIHDDKVHELELVANDLRRLVISMLAEAGSGHSAGPLGMADVFAALYFHIAKINPKKPNDPSRDKIILSNGHICPIMYAAMAVRGFFPKKELLTLRKINSRLQGHPHRSSLPGVENTSGPLGQGLSQAIGFALAHRLDKNPARVFAMLSDGEQDEGQTWEGAMLAGKQKLSNLTAIMDRNNIQIDGFTENVMPLEPLAEKYRAFNWHVIEIDGHNIRGIVEAYDEAAAIAEKPTMIIAHTIPGKGVSFMERKFEWHGKPPNAEEAQAALKELKALRKKIKDERPCA